MKKNDKESTRHSFRDKKYSEEDQETIFHRTNVIENNGSYPVSFDK